MKRIDVDLNARNEKDHVRLTTIAAIASIRSHGGLLNGERVTLVDNDGDETIEIEANVYASAGKWYAVLADMPCRFLPKPERFMKQFILWNPKEGPLPTRDEKGEIITSGSLGRVDIGNVYLTTYGVRPEGSKTYDELEIGECVPGVIFNLGGTKGSYDIYRVA